MDNNTYTAVTIGPIYNTFSQAKRTRAIWAASYFFSFFMRKVLEEAIDKNWEVMLPYDFTLSTEIRGINKGNNGAGLYADRLYFVNKTKADLQEIIISVIAFFAEDMDSQKIASTEDCKNFLTQYLNLHIIELNFSDHELSAIKSDTDNSVLKILNILLDNKELNIQYPFEFNENLLVDYFSLKWNENSALKIDAFGENSKRHFTSIGEIATFDLKTRYKKQYQEALNKDFINDDIEFINELSKVTVKYKDKDVSIIDDYHKYYAVLYADGDNVGDLLKSVANHDDKLKEFSRRLLDFGLQAEKSITEYGGSAIYLGGEDILAFLPIVNKSDNNDIKTLANVIKNLDRIFNDTLGVYAEKQEVKIPTLSYGLMLSYYKFPMREAMLKAHDLLETCKTDKKLFPGKNGISVRFQKHSGQYMECFIDKSKQKSTRLIYELLTKHIQTSDRRDTLSGLIQRLKDEVFFITFIYAVRNNRTDAFFENFFNEPVHEINSTFIDYFKALTKSLKNEYLPVTDLDEEAKRFREILFTVLRYYQFIQIR